MTSIDLVPIWSFVFQSTSFLVSTSKSTLFVLHNPTECHTYFGAANWSAISWKKFKKHTYQCCDNFQNDLVNEFCNFQVDKLFFLCKKSAKLLWKPLLQDYYCNNTWKNNRLLFMLFVLPSKIRQSIKIHIQKWVEKWKKSLLFVL